MRSSVWMGGAVHFPEWTGERIYMVPFKYSKGLPPELSRWNDTVYEMLDGIRTNKDIYLMVDQAPVITGKTHRRSGPHIDGYWLPMLNAHGHVSPMYAHGNPSPGHNNPGPDNHRSPGRHMGIDKAELILMASNITGAKAHIGEYEGAFSEGGACEFDLSGMKTIDMLSDVSWIGDVYTIHESIPHEVDGLRTLVRLNVPLH